jgi:hypothetical protein
MDILRKRTFFEETASANVEANSGDTVIPDVADMVKSLGLEDRLQSVITSQLKLNCDPDEHASSHSLPGLQGTPVYRLLPI